MAMMKPPATLGYASSLAWRPPTRNEGISSRGTPEPVPASSRRHGYSPQIWRPAYAAGSMNWSWPSPVPATTTRPVEFSTATSLGWRTVAHERSAVSVAPAIR